MNKFKLVICLFLCSLLISPSFAQMLDDEYNEPSVSESDTDSTEHEELFDEMFSEELNNPPRVESEESELGKIAEEMAKKVNEVSPQAVKPEPKANSVNAFNKKVATEGEISIGVSKGSFKLSQDLMGRTVCSFGVSLVSTLNKDIKMLALRLVYPQAAYAFIYRNVKANGSDEKFITTSGDICYNLSGVPDIDINRCRVVGGSEKDCLTRLKWDNEIISPDPSKNPYL